MKKWLRKYIGYVLAFLTAMLVLFGFKRERKVKKYDDRRLNEKTLSLEERQEEIKRQQREFDLNVENPGTHPDIESAVRDWNEGNKDGKN